MNNRSQSSIQRVETIEDLINRVKEEPAIEYVHYGITKPSVGFIYGVPKSGKTTYCECLGLSIASGLTEFMGTPININNHKVLFISLEEYYKGRTNRNIKQLDHLRCMYNTSPNGNFKVVNENMPRHINSDRDWDIIMEEVMKEMPGVVFIDSLSRLTDGELGDEEGAKKIMAKLRHISDVSGAAIIVINHTLKKANESMLTINSMSGSRVFGQEADFIIGINKTSSNERYIKPVAFRYADDNFDQVTKFTMNQNQWIEKGISSFECELLAVNDGRVDNTNQKQILEYFKLKPEETVITSKELEEKFVTPGLMTKKTLYSNLNNLMTSGEILKSEKGKYKLAE